MPTSETTDTKVRLNFIEALKKRMGPRPHRRTLEKYPIRKLS